MEDKKTFNRENNKLLDKMSRVMINKVIKVIDYLIAENTETAAKNFQVKVLLPPPDSQYQPPSLQQIKLWLISLESSFAKFLNEYDVIVSCFWDKNSDKNKKLGNACIGVIFFLVIAKLLQTPETTQFEKMLRGDGLNGFVLR